MESALYMWVPFFFVFYLDEKKTYLFICAIYLCRFKGAGKTTKHYFISCG